MGVKVESDRVRVLEKMPEGVLPPLRTSGGALLPHARSVGLDLSSPENWNSFRGQFFRGHHLIVFCNSSFMVRKLLF